MAGSNQGLLWVMRILSAIILLTAGGFHGYLVAFAGVGGTLGVLFVLHTIGSLVLGVGMLVTRGWLLRLTTVLSLLYVIVSLLSLFLALTVGLFGISETWTFTLVPETIIVEAIGIVVLAITTAVVFRTQRHASSSEPARA